MNAVGIEIENPFGEDANDLEVVQMMKRVEKDITSLYDLRNASPQYEKMVQIRAEAAEKEATQNKTDQWTREGHKVPPPPGKGSRSH